MVYLIVLDFWGVVGFLVGFCLVWVGLGFFSVVEGECKLQNTTKAIIEERCTTKYYRKMRVKGIEY